MSQLSTPNPTSNKAGGPYRKPRADVFTVLLVIALVALILGIVCLYAEMEAYEWKFKNVPTVSLAAPAESGFAEKQFPGGPHRTSTALTPGPSPASGSGELSGRAELG